MKRWHRLLLNVGIAGAVPLFTELVKSAAQTNSFPSAFDVYFLVLNFVLYGLIAVGTMTGALGGKKHDP